MMMMRVIEQLQRMMMKHLLMDYQVVMAVGGSQTGVLSKILLVPVVVVVALTVVQVMKEVVEVDDDLQR